MTHICVNKLTIIGSSIGLDNGLAGASDTIIVHFYLTEYPKFAVNVII